jgi:hypothetical protein
MLGDGRVAGTAAGPAGFAIPPELIWPILALVGLFFLGAGIIAWIDRWRKRHAGAPPLAEDDLGTYQALFDKGELSREELEQIRARLTSGGAPKPPSPGESGK